MFLSVPIIFYITRLSMTIVENVYCSHKVFFFRIFYWIIPKGKEVILGASFQFIAFPMTKMSTKEEIAQNQIPNKH